MQKIGASIAVALLTTLQAWAADAASFSVKAVAADRPSLLFIESEPVNVKALVKGGTGSVQVDYTVKETCGDWSAKGSLTIPRKGSGDAEIKIPLSFPGRGHFKLNLVANCGDMLAKDSTSAGIVYRPLPADVDSPWGMMWGVYRGLPPNLNPEDAPAHIAESMRMMGVSWTRLTVWEHTYKIKVEGEEVVLDLSRLRRQVDEFRKRGINILGEFVQTPRILSSKPDSKDAIGDGGPLYCRVKPADYKLWNQMVEKIAREFKDDIPVWEVWNEAETDHFWVGTAAEFVEHLEHACAAIRKGSPSAKIAASGFTSRIEKCEPFFKAGFGKSIDILSVHYTDRRDRVEEYMKLQEKYGLKLPIVNTEEAAVVPLNNLARGVRSFKYIHMHDDANLKYRPIMKMDWSVNPTAVSYSVGARLIGSKKLLRTKDLPGFKVYFFGEEGGIAVIAANRGASPAKLLDSMFIDRILVKAVPAEGKELAGIDALGRERKLSGGVGEMPFSLIASFFKQNKDMVFAAPECVFIRGCKDIASVERIEHSNTIIVEAEKGDFDRSRIGVSAKPEFSGGKYLDIHSKEAPGADGYGVDLKVEVPAEGDYVVHFSGNDLSRLKKPASISSFHWSFDDGPKTLAGEKPLKVMGNTVGDIDGAPEGLSELGTVHLTKGKHIFKLRLAAPREKPDSNWALWFDAIALIPVQ